MKLQYYKRQHNQIIVNPSLKLKKINIILISTFLIVKLLVAGCLTIQFIGYLINYYNQTGNSYPTSLPWINNKSECEHRGREWQGEKCWDSEHNMLF
ncbi:hypothetical protein DSM106972_064000 [Dulcicalothrix desertica PCC 7102]|uniref:Uncharacterized protein n=1 Tax=Dulcicalothrix desertica PCC 7102 TaxID=232991 RepID=A0A433V6R9_9CYAN|nr:hypothetical protein [Dulcicalothrix desertica]RUT01777.1 hypothetical protein DSM106972_064000 [Dulcicalothrix desertica PCC 7102]TWH42929.1 hypothetical protein CAL7102_06614 [Dulcicalothrix desertica PCC 7102]